MTAPTATSPTLWHALHVLLDALEAADADPAPLADLAALYGLGTARLADTYRTLGAAGWVEPPTPPERAQDPATVALVCALLRRTLALPDLADEQLTVVSQAVPLAQPLPGERYRLGEGAPAGDEADFDVDAIDDVLAAADALRWDEEAP